DVCSSDLDLWRPAEGSPTCASTGRLCADGAGGAEVGAAQKWPGRWRREMVGCPEASRAPVPQQKTRRTARGSRRLGSLPGASLDPTHPSSFIIHHFLYGQPAAKWFWKQRKSKKSCSPFWSQSE